MGLLNEELEQLLREFFSLKQDDWVEWVAKDNDFRDDCDKFNGCYFVIKQMPMYPQHPRCQCKLKKIAKTLLNITAKANCDIRKFNGYIFSDKYDDGKREIFEFWGFDTGDSEYLQSFYIAQAQKKYCQGEYEYVGTNAYFPKIKIIIEISDKDGNTQKINTIWQLGKRGEITLITPYSGHSY